jgi:carbonic anhydrase
MKNQLQIHALKWTYMRYDKTNSHASRTKGNQVSMFKMFSFILLFFIFFNQSFGQAPVKPEEALLRLQQGNKRFVEGKPLKPNQDLNRIKEVSKKQFPFATIIGCSDSRVPNEIIFDQGVGDLFIVRTAGQVSTYASWGSIEFAEEVLGTKLIVVLGHTACGAVNATVNNTEAPGHIVTLLNAIKPAVEKAKLTHPADLLDASIRENIRMQVDQLKALEPLLAKRVREGSIKIVGALYHLDSGEVEFLD